MTDQQQRPPADDWPGWPGPCIRAGGVAYRVPDDLDPGEQVRAHRRYLGRLAGEDWLRLHHLVAASEQEAPEEPWDG